jgi:hypothetical protein
MLTAAVWRARARCSPSGSASSTDAFLITVISAAAPFDSVQQKSYIHEKKLT